jgi:glycosyltransferase involved in cell wall biosynthesis
MRVILLHQYYKTPEEGGGIRSWYLCRTLKKAGHDVEVVTSWNKEEKNTITVDGYKVHYLPVHYHNNLSAIRRIRAFLRFFRAAYNKVVQLPKADAVYAISTPLTVGVLALLIKRRLKTPYFFEVGDLWPDVPVQMGYIKNPMLILLLKKIELAIYKSARGIVAMSPAMTANFHRLGLSDKTVCVTNFSDLNLQASPAQLNSEVFTVTYAGTLGKANRLTYLLDLAEEAQRRGIGNFRCVIIGEGAEENTLKLSINERNLSNISVKTHTGKPEAVRILSQSSMAYLSFGPHDLLWTGSPNKYFDALAIGKPVLCNFGGWIADEITTKSCGITYRGSNPKEFFDNHWDRLQMPGTLPKMGQNARALAVDKYSLEKQIPKWLAFIESQ